MQLSSPVQVAAALLETLQLRWHRSFVLAQFPQAGDRLGLGFTAGFGSGQVDFKELSHSI